MIMSIRNQKGDIRQRILAYSSDGGQSWEEVGFDEELPDPVCQGSVLDLGERDGKTILAHSNNANETERDQLTVKISFDGGKNWELTIPIDYAGDESKLPWTAYSDLVKLNDTTLGILYERDDYREIVFKQVVWKRE